MAKRPARPANMPWVSPYLTVRDADKAADFYAMAFGFEKRVAMPGPDGRTAHVEMVYQDAVIMFGPENAYNSNNKSPITLDVISPVGLYIYCNNVDVLFTRATAAGAQGVSPPTDMFYGDRVCLLIDPDGHRWHFATNVAEFDPTKIPTGPNKK